MLLLILITQPFENASNGSIDAWKNLKLVKKLREKGYGVIELNHFASAMMFIPHIRTCLLTIVFSGTWLLADIATAQPTAKKCSAVMAQVKATLPQVKRFSVGRIETKYDGTPPQGRSQYASIIFMGERSPNEAIMAQKIIANCRQIATVSFILDGTDDERRYGLLNGKVQPFKCKDITEKVRWGEFGCP